MSLTQACVYSFLGNHYAGECQVAFWPCPCLGLQIVWGPATVFAKWLSDVVVDTFGRTCLHSLEWCFAHAEREFLSLVNVRASTAPWTTPR